MLHQFLKQNRSELIERCRTKVEKRRAPTVPPDDVDHGIPLFLDQLTQMLPGGANPEAAGQTSTTAPASAASVRMEEGAVLHGQDQRRNNFSIEQVVHGYGDLCQSITQLASEKNFAIDANEFGVLNIRLDNAIADAVSEFSRGSATREAIAGATAETLGTITHEMRNLHTTCAIALRAMERGTVGFGGATAGALRASLTRMGTLIERAAGLSEPPKS